MLKAGQIVKSIAGHDKDSFYVLVDVEKNYVTIADGKLRKLEKPKRKNVLHVRPTNTLLDLEVLATDKKLRKALADYREDADDTKAEGGY